MAVRALQLENQDNNLPPRDVGAALIWRRRTVHIHRVHRCRTALSEQAVLRCVRRHVLIVCMHVPLDLVNCALVSQLYACTQHPYALSFPNSELLFGEHWAAC
jgi:hypothetical protein